MFRHTVAFTIALLLGSFVIMESAEARATRSTIERRQSPGGGYWAKSHSSHKSTSAKKNFFQKQQFNRFYSR